jgi:glycosyltransferase involved in cell wall biosynthesis
MIELVRRRADEFDVLHFHIDFHPFSVFSRQKVPFLTTLHGRLDQGWIPQIYDLFPEVPLVSISNRQRAPMPHLNFAATILHGMPADQLRPQPAPQDYFAFLGRISPEKGIERAIRIAQACGVTLKVAAKIDKVDEEYFKAEVEPLLSTGGVEFIGEINDAQKPAFLSGAKALLFAIDWPEPFGLVMIEAMACGCPVIAFRRGSVPEVMDDGVTGFIVDNVEEAIAACGKLDKIDRTNVRAQFDRRFTSRRMAEDYVAVYEKLIARKQESDRLEVAA